MSKKAEKEPRGEQATGGAGPQKLKALIVDDEPLIRAELREMLMKSGKVEVVGESARAKEALKLIEALDYDVVFLDIQMPGLTGLEVAERIKELPRPPLVIFVTAYSRYAPKAFDLDVADYILKPFDETRLDQAIAKAFKWKELHEGPPPAEAAAQKPEEVFDEQSLLAAIKRAWGWEATKDTRPKLDRLPVDKGGKTILLPFEEIVFAKAYEDYSYVNTATESYLTNFSLKQLEKRFKDARFFRAHRKYLVNLEKVTELVSMPGGNFLLRTTGDKKVEIPLSRRRVKSLKKIIGL